MEENGVTKIDYENFISGNEKKSEKYIWSDYITNTLLVIALIMVVVALMLLGIAKDCGVLDSHYIDNTIGIVPLLFALVSIPRIKESIGKKLTGPSLLKKLWCLVMIVCIPFYIVLIMNLVGLSSSVSNFCGLIGIIISIFTW